MAAASIKWDGAAYKAKVDAEMGRRVNAACMILERIARELISVAGTAIRKAGIRLQNKDGTFKRMRNASPSAPGDPPHKQTGHLRRSVTREVIGLIGRVGTNLKYGRWLELGTRIMAARPWLRPALAASLTRIYSILTRPLPF